MLFKPSRSWQLMDRNWLLLAFSLVAVISVKGDAQRTDPPNFADPSPPQTKPPFLEQRLQPELPSSPAELLLYAEKEDAKEWRSQLEELHDLIESKRWLVAKVHLRDALTAAESSDEIKESKAAHEFLRSVLELLVEDHDATARQIKLKALGTIRGQVSNRTWRIIHAHLQRAIAARKELSGLEAQEEFGLITVDLLLSVRNASTRRKRNSLKRRWERC